MRTVLVIAYYFPPSVDAGAKRALGFFRSLRAYGYDPIVVTVKDGNYCKVGELAVPEDERVFRVQEAPLAFRRPFASRESGRQAPPAAGRVRGLLRRLYHELIYVPDAYNGFFTPACQMSLALIRRRGVDLIFTMSSPYTALRIGHRLTVQTGIPWVADLRDLWVRNHFGYRYSRARKALDSYLEGRWLSRARAVTTVTKGLRRTLQEQYGWSHVHCIYNGFLGPLAPPEGLSRRPQRDQPFRISFTGKLYAEPTHSVRPLCEALDRLRVLDLEGFRQVSVDFLGIINPEFNSVVAQFGLEETIKYRGLAGPEQAVRMQQDSDLLLILIPQDQEVSVPTKMFDYMAAFRPILLIGPCHGEAAGLVNSIQAGAAFDSWDTEAIARFLAHVIHRKRETAAVWSEADPARVEEFSYRKLTGQLVGVFDSVLGV